MQPEDLFGTDIFGNPIQPKENSILAKEFIEPPFSVLNANSKRWNRRKNAWLSYGIKSELGRDAKHVRLASVPDYFPKRWHQEKPSIFDPVLCEIMYTWFCPEGGQILDPFAGGSVRGITAHMLGYEYYGIELRPEQVEANQEQASDIYPGHDIHWVIGDASEALQAAPEADFIFTCPPYGNLEVYSDDPKDLSTMDYPDFIQTLGNIIYNSISRLKGEYACFVVSNYRDKKGYYHNFVGDIISLFEYAGMRLYNDMILLTPTGTAAMIARGHFSKSKKVTKTHQNVLVFKKDEYYK